MRWAVIGFGELGRQLFSMTAAEPQQNDIVIFDDVCFAGGMKNSRPFYEFLNPVYSDCFFILGLGYKHLSVKHRVLGQLKESERSIITIIHPSAFVNASSVISDGAVIYPMCNIDKESVIGPGALLNNSVIVSHNTEVGACAYLSPGVILSGYVRVGCNTFIGSGAVVVNGVTIGDNTVVAAGTLVSRNVPDNSFVIGNPMRLVKKLHIF
jgi:sugar O-acyltransferase (sialic acid O-acetyltransferase NeuD family)